LNSIRQGNEILIFISSIKISRLQFDRISRSISVRQNFNFELGYQRMLLNRTFPEKTIYSKRLENSLNFCLFSNIFSWFSGIFVVHRYIIRFQ